MSETLLRQWAMLRAIPRAPRWIEPDTLLERLCAEGLDTTLRTIQRDLNTLSAAFPLLCDDRQRPHRWSWLREAPVWDIPGMEPSTALTFKLVESFIPHLLPPQVRNHLAGHFERAEGVLSQLAEESSFRNWTDRVRVINRGMSLRAPETPPEITDAVYSALLQGRQFRAHYRSRAQSQEEPREYVINPVGLVVRDNVLYLVCTLWDYDDIRQLVLHRMSAVEVLDEPARRPKEFDLDDYVRSGSFDIVWGEPIRLVALFDAAAAFHLHETPLAEDQKITGIDDGRVELSATVRDTSQLRWWLFAFGDQVEVVKPESLRREVADASKRMVRHYTT